ncbi:hypothetical protein [Actinomycetospora sp. CA-084318]|uniref:hypothetical protein n=1 Tax=Actinomycetospora sp. CA-084318 TaxID=3239892 RepID=UPI003D958E40
MTGGHSTYIVGDFVSQVLVTALPVPVRVEAPPGWEHPTTLPPGVAFAVGHPSPDRGVRATITMDGDTWSPHESLEDVASRVVERLAGAGCQDIVVLAREHVGTTSAPATTQRVALRSIVGGELRDLVQDQVYLGLVDQGDPSLRAVVRLVLTAASEQHDEVAAAFQAMVKSVSVTDIDPARKR